jgi:RecJ-like exonuclease
MVVSMSRHYREPPIGSHDPVYGTFLRHPMDPRTDPDAGLQPCIECDGAGFVDDEPCPFCDGMGHFLNDEPCSAEQYERLVDDRY